MITLYSAMQVTLGFLVAALLVVVLLPAYRRRIERFAIESLKRTLPLTEAEIRADRDGLRAGYAMDVHKLEMQIEEANLAAARQSVEINRRDARINDLSLAIAAQKMSVDEHENARRVLEQAILDRLPKVEQRLADTRRMLAERDREIVLLTDASRKQTSALEEATQLNLQQTDELHRVRAALETRAARNRETLGDPRFDGEVALRTEIEMLRTKSRDQAAMIDRLQKSRASSHVADEAASTGDEAIPNEVERLKAELGKVEAQLLSFKSNEDRAEANRPSLEARIVELDSAARDRNAEIAKLSAALKAYESGDANVGLGITAKAEIRALQAEVEEQRRTIQALRADLAGGNEKLARQAQHFRDELRRLGSGAIDGARNAAEPPRLSLAERIAAPKLPRPAQVESDAASSDRNVRPSGFLKAVNGGAESHGEDNKGPPALPAASVTSDAAVPEPPRRPRLLERISGLDKPV